LYAAYEFNAPHDSLVKDLLGVTDGYLQGNPGWVNSDGQLSGFLTFNGANQFVVLDRSLSDVKEITVTAWVKWSGGASNQPVWFFGSAATNGMFFTPNDGTGKARFSIISNSVVQSLASPTALPVGVWTHVTVSLSNSVTGRLYINGTNVATGSITLTPDQLNAPNVNTAGQQNFLARGAGNSLPFFQGALDSVRVYTGPLTGAEITLMQKPAALAAAGTLYVDLRATNATYSSLAIFNTWTNFGFAVGNFTMSGSPAYSTNVAATGIPGVWFDGTTALYSSTNTSITDITGASDRTIEVWVYNPSLSDEETMVSLGDRSGTRMDCAFNFGSASGWGAATHFGDDVPWGAMGFPSTNGWHHLVYTYDGNVTVKIYADGQLWFTDTLGGALATPAGDSINIGCQRGSGGGGAPGQFFSGYINAVRVWGAAMTASQVASNYSFGPWTLPAAPKAISFATLSNVTVNAGVTVNFTNSATDPNLPPLPVAFNLLSAPAGTMLNSGSGIFTWRPTVAQAGTTNLISIQAANNGTPGLAATQSFFAIVNPVSRPQISRFGLTNGQIALAVSGDTGPDYFIQASTNLSQWQNIFTNLSPTLPFSWTAPVVTNFTMQFYRVLLGP
jgi:hypothetical protein